MMLMLSSCIVFLPEQVKADYADESTTDSSYIAWITLFDTSGDVIINWTSLNDDVEPNVNSQNVRVGYWSAGIYIDESTANYMTYPQEAITFYLTFTNLTEDISWYANSLNMENYFSSYHDYGSYDIVILKTPDWSEQMTYDWWRLDQELEVNATLYVDNGFSEVINHNPEDGTNSTRKVQYLGTNLVAGRANYTQISVNIGGVAFSYSAPNYNILREYVFVPNYYNTTNATSLRLGWTPWAPNGDSSSIMVLVYSLPVMTNDWNYEYWQYTNWGPNPIQQIFPGETQTKTYADIPYSSNYGDYILLCVISSADFEGLSVNAGSDYLYIASLQDYYTITENEDIIESYSFSGNIINHEQYEIDGRSIVWLLLGLLPALILGYFIGRPGVIAGLAIMALVNGYSQPNYFWVMALTLGICAIMLYKGGVR